MTLKFWSISLFVLLVGCSNQVATPNTYVCGEQLEIWSHPINEYELQIELDNERFLMTRVPSASGEKYENRYLGLVFWTKGSEASLSMPDSPLQMCTQMNPNKTSLSSQKTLF
ncbi:conserved hypothetical protein [Vibrio nigripulchritudo MADA3029]|uniref:C-type lysozyme inhibitor domain-containing protein n=1 Tax=Vibrio nigripulchritudo TaxID=28173 RepID=U4KE14_9VIBR|nr:MULTISPECIES: MliC family protein [Vibrio]EGU60423.1 hypothetical protein VINI7043_02100 [Vibrio nigripulchritudo ATCC 27043]KJY80151.1 hypothetical protein TW74_07320 [Vibrio nigripulchritudo]UAB69663.1 MliC family protein [Vibrio sp. SCSIO 43132]CCN46398.1 conserved hypothetical protein [Vibrio nigripulchritudo MADA3020]CCN53468.1 conserved hypothetical protein [Vibrio nigripulchritudo MADA3021]